MVSDPDWIALGQVQPFLTARVENIILVPEPNLEVLQFAYSILKIQADAFITSERINKWQNLANLHRIPLIF